MTLTLYFRVVPNPAVYCDADPVRLHRPDAYRSAPPDFFSLVITFGAVPARWLSVPATTRACSRVTMPCAGFTKRASLALEMAIRLLEKASAAFQDHSFGPPPFLLRTSSYEQQTGAR